MEAQEIEALAMVGATAIVSAMATDVWSSARDRAVALFRHHSPERQAELETRLETNADQVQRAGDVERARGDVVGSWRLELGDLLTSHPDAADDLAALSDQVRAVLPAASQQWVQNNTARDHGVVNTVQHGTQHNHYMDATDPRPWAGLAPDESQS